MKKVFFIIYSFSKGGGAESLLTMIVNNLNPDKYDIGIMEIIHDEVKAEPINKNIKIFPYYVRADDPERKAKMYYVYHEWDKVIEEYIPQDYDLYVSFNFLRSSFLLPPDRKNIAWIHGGIPSLAQENRREEWMLQNIAFYKADRIVSISDVTTQSLEELFPWHKDKIRVIYNGIDIEQIRAKAKEETVINLKHPALISIGRLDANKNPIRMLRIFEQVHKRKPEVHLYYLGYGDLEEDVKGMAKDIGLSKQVHLLGYYDNPFPIVAQSDVVCMFSISEGFPMVLLEGVALSKPFVSSIVGGARILANEEKCGKTTETDEEAADKILELLQADKNIISMECEKSVSRFALRTYIRQIEELFDEVLNEDK